MQAEQVKRLLEQDIPRSQAEVQRNGNRFAVTVISESFAGLSPVAAHQRVYTTLATPLASGEIHALEIHTFTPAAYAARQPHP